MSKVFPGDEVSFTVEEQEDGKTRAELETLENTSFKEFKGVLAPYEMCSQSYIDDLMRKHSSSMLIIDSIYYSTSIPEMVYQRLAMLEEYYYNETHKIKIRARF